jgi:hypothetical protein
MINPGDLAAVGLAFKAGQDSTWDAFPGVSHRLVPDS